MELKVILNEQVHKNLYRSYFCGHQDDYDLSKATFKNISFYTTNPLYALFYAKKNKHWKVTEYKLKDKVNIFNARSRTDFDKLHKYINENSIPISFDTLEDLKDHDWSYCLGSDEKRNEVLDIIFGLGYDGFFNYEYDKIMKRDIEAMEYDVDIPDTNNNPAIGILSNDVFIKVKDYHSVEELLKFDIVSDFLEDEKKKVKRNYNWLRNKFGKDTAYNGSMAATDKYLVLSVDEAVELVNDAVLNYKEPTIDELKEQLIFLKSVHRPGFKDAAERLEKRINAQTK